MDMNIMKKILKKYEHCKFCGKKYSAKDNDKFDINPDGTFIRNCSCGWSIDGYITQTGKIKINESEQNEKLDFLNDVRHDSFDLYDVNTVFDFYPNWLTDYGFIKKIVSNYKKKNLYIIKILKSYHADILFDLDFLQHVINEHIENLLEIAELTHENFWKEKTDTVTEKILTKTNILNYLKYIPDCNNNELHGFFTCLPQKCLDDDELANRAIKYGCFFCLPNKYRADYQYALQAIIINPNNAKYISDNLKADKEFFKFLIVTHGKEIYKSYQSMLSYANEPVKNDKLLIKYEYKYIGDLLPDFIYGDDKEYCRQLFTARFMAITSDIKIHFSKEELTDSDTKKQLLKYLLQTGELTAYTYSEIIEAAEELKDEESLY